MFDHPFLSLLKVNPICSFLCQKIIFYLYGTNLHTYGVPLELLRTRKTAAEKYERVHHRFHQS